MKFSPKEYLVFVVSAALASLALVSIAKDSWQGAAACVVALQSVVVTLGLYASRRRRALGDARTLRRIERALDNVSLRIVTESQATQRELGGRLDDLGRAED